VDDGLFDVDDVQTLPKQKAGDCGNESDPVLTNHGNNKKILIFQSFQEITTETSSPQERHYPKEKGTYLSTEFRPEMKWEAGMIFLDLKTPIVLEGFCVK